MKQKRVKGKISERDQRERKGRRLVLILHLPDCFFITSDYFLEGHDPTQIYQVHKHMTQVVNSGSRIEEAEEVEEIKEVVIPP